jgi:hypothetical protein
VQARQPNCGGVSTPRALGATLNRHLLHVLLEELDGPPDPDAEVARLEEIQRRSRELDEGSVNAIPAKEVFEKLRGRLKAHGS